MAFLIKQLQFQKCGNMGLIFIHEMQVQGLILIMSSKIFMMLNILENRIIGLTFNVVKLIQITPI